MTETHDHVLVVDDEPSVLVTYRLILEQEGYKVSAALTSDEARNVLIEGGVDLLLCDLSLEKQVSGFEVISFGRAADANLACVLLTGYATPEAIEMAERQQIPMLFKPIEIKQLLETIHALLRDKDEIRQTTRR